MVNPILPIGLVVIGIYYVQKKNPNDPTIKLIQKYKWPLIIGLLGLILSMLSREHFSTLYMIISIILIGMLYLIARAKP